MKPLRTLLLRFALVNFCVVNVWGIVPGWATTYYVDFEMGHDKNAGLSSDTAWKRSPHDPDATDIPSQVALLPGDTVLFKGGVKYRGRIALKVSGSTYKPITFKGDGWGSKKAQLDGGEPWNALWKVCTTRDIAKGNPDFSHIYYALAPTGFSDFKSGLYEDGEFLWYSQGPDVADPFYYDNNYQYYPIEPGSSSTKQSRHSITDRIRFTQVDANFWLGAHIATWVKGNLIEIKPVVAFDPDTHTIQHEELAADPYTDRKSYYSMLNHVSLISRPGEFAYDPASDLIFVWPRNSASALEHEYSTQIRSVAFDLGTQSHVNIEGFNIQHYAQAISATSTSASGIVVKDNEISNLRSGNRYAIHVNAADSLIERNRVLNCQRGVGILSSASGIIVSNNLVSRTSRQGIWFMGAKRSQIVGNTITDIQGSHANGLSIYSESSDILIANNVISLASSSISYEQSRDLLFFGNVVDGGGRNHASSDWFGCSGRITFINNTFVRHPQSPCILELRHKDAEYVIVNNILDGGGPQSSRHINNLFLREPGWPMDASEQLEVDLSKVFVNPDGSDWRCRSDSAAIDTGVDPTEYLPTLIFPDFDFHVDAKGNRRGTGNGWDRGAFESR
jgi:parallel beta-helix repeat protein